MHTCMHTYNTYIHTYKLANGQAGRQAGRQGRQAGRQLGPRKPNGQPATAQSRGGAVPGHDPSCSEAPTKISKTSKTGHKTRHHRHRNLSSPRLRNIQTGAYVQKPRNRKQPEVRPERYLETPFGLDKNTFRQFPLEAAPGSYPNRAAGRQTDAQARKHADKPSPGRKQASKQENRQSRQAGRTARRQATGEQTSRTRRPANRRASKKAGAQTGTRQEKEKQTKAS